MRRLGTALLWVTAATAAYVFAWPSANIPYFVAVVLHVIAGAVLFFAVLFGLRKLLRDASATARIGWIALLAGGALGLVLVYTGTLRADWPLLYAHIALCVAGIALLISAWLGKRGWLARTSALAGLRSAACLIILAGAIWGAWWLRTAPWIAAFRIRNPPMAPASMNDEGDGPRGFFFPSSGQTETGQHIPASYFTQSDSCQRCHADIYREWFSSAHHYSSFNNAWYRKSIEYMQDTIGIRPSKWCAGCHDPALLYSGMFDRPVREIEDTPAGQAGLGCMMCHSIARVKSTMGQGDYVLEYPALHRLAASKNPLLRGLHDYLTRLNPEPHRRVFLKPFMRNDTAQFCSVCHKVHLDVPVNHYRWTRGFNEYDNWQASGISGFGARSFYYPPRSMQCADCHMPQTHSLDAGNIGGFIHSHRFPAANTALPYVNGDIKQLDTVEGFLKANQVTVDIFAISPETAPPNATGAAAGAAGPLLQQETTFAVGEESETSIPVNTSPEAATPVALLSAPLNRISASVQRGKTYRVDVVVRTRGVGHFFPGGTVDAYDCWVALKATDNNGRVLFWSGAVADNGKGPVDPGAHFYRSLQIDEHGNPINKRNAWATRATVYVRLIPPGAADTVHYRLYVPPDAGERIHLTASLNYRKFDWWFTQFAFAGVYDRSQRNQAFSPDFDDSRFVFTGNPRIMPGGEHGIPNLPIVTMSESSAELNVLPASAAQPKPQMVFDPNDGTRWNDYGIGLFLQGDLTGAAVAFQNVTRAAPKNPDGWVNIGRVRVQEGSPAAARQALDRALALSPNLARAHFFYAQALKQQGDYEGAAAHLRRVLDQYPRDRVARNDLGRILFLQRRYAEAVRQFDAALSIDPEDLEANYNLMLCYTGLGEPQRAKEFQVRYLRFKADEASQTLTGPYRRAHPYDNTERQPIHEHVSDVAATAAPQKYAIAGRAEGW